ncbi:FecR family protein [Pedobacter nyackensis]|uniref:FecR family protein n=1 Tax=Pedobacter nyackensis TaxID=475255 RepID=A0A1W2EL06_9SPHI|nr:FecR family protein [Pedobacter nyackensis]SMD10409.1 FecR family protein [Pedobacter nyackensis]
MGYNKANNLIEKYLGKKATLKEEETVESWYINYARNKEDKLPEPDYEAVEAEVWSILEPKPKRSWSWQRIGIAASVALMLSLGIYFYNSSDRKMASKAKYATDIVPGRNRAIIRLANGKQIYLSDLKSGVSIKGKQLVYDDGSNIEAIHAKDAEVLTISTPRGGQYNVELPDGTLVTLNAASTLKFPSTFLGALNRVVELDGEGYFKVVKNKDHPFIVNTTKQDVKVLGTHFNISAYADDPTTLTTLEEGLVEVRSKNGSKGTLLKPNQQSILTASNRITVKEVNVTDELAWKNGLFIFNEENLESTMRKISRWYDVEIYYQDKLPPMSFLGSISRSKSLSTVINLLEKSGGVHFKIEGRRVIVMK